MRLYQRGVGLIEVLVALLLLAVGVLGFSVLQLRAMDASQEAGARTIAMNSARDLAERMRINRTALATYQTAINSKDTLSSCLGTTATYLPNCNSVNMAKNDAREILEKVASNGQMIRIEQCSGSNLQCIYLAWGKTDISQDVTSCVDSDTGSYKSGATCLIMETF